MIRTRTRKILRDVFSRKMRTLLVSISIFIGVLGVIALLTVRDLIVRQLEEDVREDELTMIDVEVSLRSGEEVDNAALLQLLNQNTAEGQQIETLDGISIVEAQAIYPIEFRHVNDEQFEEAELRSYSTLLQDVQLEPMRLVEDGEWPRAGQNEVALETRMADRYGFSVGDTIVFQVAGENGIEAVEYTISGLVFHPYSYKRPGPTGALTPGPEDGIYAQYEDAQSLLDLNGFNVFVARYENFEKADTQFEAFQNVIKANSPYRVIFALLENPAENGQVLNAETFGNILSLLALVAMVVSGFLVVNVVNTIVVEQKRQIGVLKALGATRLDNFFIYAGIAFTYGAIGTTFALIPGVLLGYQLALTLAPQLDVLIEGFQLSWTSIIFGMVMGLVVPVLAATIPVYNGTRVRIMDAITDLGIGGDYGQGRIARFIGGLPLPFGFRQALSNVVQKKGRLALTGMTLTLAIGSSMGVFAMGISLNKAVQDIFNRLDYQITVIPYEVQDLESTKQTLESLDEITTANPGVIMSIEIVGDYENFFTRNNQVVAFGVIPEEKDYTWNYEAGTGWDNDPDRDGVVISAPMADQLGVTAGDTITFVVSGNQVTEEVIGIEGAAFDAMWIHWERLALLAGFTEDGPVPNQYIVPARIGEELSPIFAFGMDGNAANLFNPGTGLPVDSVLLTDVFAEAQNIEEGGTVQLSVGETTVERTVAGLVPYDRLVEEASRFELDVPIVPENVVMFLFTDLLSLSGDSEFLENAAPLPNGYYLSTNLDDPTIESVDKVIDKVETALGQQGINSEIQNQVEQFSEISDLIVQYTAILSLAAILIAAVGAVGLLTTLTITVFERQKEIGVMRSIGAGSTAIGLQFMTEGILIGIMAWVIGIPISYFLALGLNAAFRLETVKFTYPFEVLILGLVGMIVIAGLASLGPSLSAARKTVSDILRYQ